MIINEKLRKNLLDLKNSVDLVLKNNSITDLQIENFLMQFEKNRYNILNEIKIYNKTVEFEYEKIKNIDDDYEAEFNNNVLKIYVPEVMPSMPSSKNLKTHTYKRILLNIAEITKSFSNIFENKVCIYVKVFDKTLGWDIDNKYIKPVADGLILSNVIKDDNITKMFYCVKGEYSENPHTEIYVFESNNMTNFVKIHDTQK